MIALIPAPYRLLAVGAALALSHGVVGAKAWQWSRERVEARLARDVAALEARANAATEAARITQAALQRLRQAQAAETERIEDEARTDPDALSRVPSADSLSRLKRRPAWRTD